MIDNDMTNILKNFANAEQGTGKVVDPTTGTESVSAAKQEKDAMKKLLEGLDAQQKSVNQMPGQHKMGSGYGKEHPAEKFLVGGKYDERPRYAKEYDPEDLYGDSTEGIITDEDYREMAEAYGIGFVMDHVKKHHPEKATDILLVLTAEKFHESADQPTDNNKFAPGTTVHVGHQVPHGSGIEGKVVEIRGEWVIIEKDGKKYKGQLKNTTVVESTIDEVVEPIEEGLRTVKVTYDNGDSITTDMAAGLSDEQIHDYFAIGKRINIGDGMGGDKIVHVADVEILEDKFGEKKPSRDVYEKESQSLSDIFYSMEESEEDLAERFRRELHGEAPKKELNKGDNGKYDLAEEDTGWGDELIEDLKLLVSEAASMDGIIDTQQILDLIEKYEA